MESPASSIVIWSCNIIPSPSKRDVYYAQDRGDLWLASGAIGSRLSLCGRCPLSVNDSDRELGLSLAFPPALPLVMIHAWHIDSIYEATKAQHKPGVKWGARGGGGGRLPTTPYTIMTRSSCVFELEAILALYSLGPGTLAIW